MHDTVVRKPDLKSFTVSQGQKAKKNRKRHTRVDPHPPEQGKELEKHVPQATPAATQGLSEEAPDATRANLGSSGCEPDSKCLATGQQQGAAAATGRM